MPRVTYIVDGVKQTVEGATGDSVMITAVQNGLDGIVAECGGSCSCATCHVYVDEAWIERTGRATEEESELLEELEVQVPPLQVLLVEPEELEALLPQEPLAEDTEVRELPPQELPEEVEVQERLLLELLVVLLLLGLVYVRRAERNEAAFTDVIERS